MMDALIRWSLRNRPAIVVLGLVLLATGTWFAAKMDVDVFPDLTAPTVTVLTEAHGMAPSDVESQITFPIEAAVNGRKVDSRPGSLQSDSGAIPSRVDFWERDDFQVAGPS